MNPALKIFGTFGLAIAKQLFPAVAAAEVAFKGLKGKGKDKQEHALNLLLAALELEGQIAGKQLLTTEALDAIRAAIDATVLAIKLVDRDTHAKQPFVPATAAELLGAPHGSTGD